MLLLEQNIIGKGRVNEINTTKLDAGNNESRKYQMETI